jgi:hypothetical protein
VWESWERYVSNFPTQDARQHQLVLSNSLITMPAVALPQLRSDLKKIVKYPTAPANPPTFKDVAAAINLSHEVMAARRLCHHTLNDKELTSVS